MIPFIRKPWRHFGLGGVDPYPFTYTDLTHLIAQARQELINSVVKLYRLTYAGRKLPGMTSVPAIIFFIPGKRNRLIRKARAEIKEKRHFLDDLERALDLALDWDTEERPKIDYYKGALK